LLTAGDFVYGDAIELEVECELRTFGNVESENGFISFSLWSRLGRAANWTGNLSVQTEQGLAPRFD
jgi:hypothetical protein